MSELLAAARARLESEGSAALSLRAVARDLGMASSAVYRYVASRDALLTLLIIEAYDAVGEVAEKARPARREPTPRRLAGGRARRARLGPRPAVLVRADLRHPGARLPRAGRHRRAAVRLWGVIIGLLMRGARRGHPDPGRTRLRPAPAAWHPRCSPPPAGPTPTTVPDEIARIAVRSATLFTSLVGAISVELFGHLHHVAGDYARLFDVTIATSAAGVGLRITLD